MTLEKERKPGADKMHMSDVQFALLMILPAIWLLTVVVLLPILQGIYTSFCEYKIANVRTPFWQAKWNSFANYAAVFKGGEVLEYFKNTIVYVGLSVSIQYMFGMCIALLLNSSVRGRGVFRGLFLIPWTIPSVIVAIMFRWMLQQQYGVLNYIFYTLRLSSTINISWTQYPANAMVMVVMAAVWRQLPYMTVMILAGLQSVDSSLNEAAAIDGANRFEVFRHITRPSIRPVVSTAVWIAILQNFQMFTTVYNMTGGGPVNSTTTLGIAVYRRAFNNYNFGEGSAIGVLWLTMLFGATLLYNRWNDKQLSNL